MALKIMARVTCKTTINAKHLLARNASDDSEDEGERSFSQPKHFVFITRSASVFHFEILLIDLLITKLQQSSVGFLLLSLPTKSFEGHGTLNISALPPKAALHLAVDCEGNGTLAV